MWRSSRLAELQAKNSAEQDQMEVTGLGLLFRKELRSWKKKVRNNPKLQLKDVSLGPKLSEQ